MIPTRLQICRVQIRRMRFRETRIPALVLAATLLMGLLLLAPAAQAQTTDLIHGTAAQAPALGESPVLADLSACLAERKAGDLVLLVDTSGSLGGDNGTDPTAVRVAAAQALLGRLAASFAQIDAKVDVGIAGFDDDVTQVVDFTALNTDAVPGLDAALQSFSTRDRGAETDYWSALTWLNRTLQAKAQARGNELGTACQFAIWFTDGEFTIGPRDGSSDAALDPLNNQTKDIPGFEDVPLTSQDQANAAKEAAQNELCRVGGPADQMRAAGITLIGVGLGTGGADDPKFTFMRDYVENASGSCGGEPSRGVFVPATSVGELFLALDRIGELGAANQTFDPQKICQVQICPEGTYAFTLDNTLSKVHLAAVVADGSGALIRSGIQVEITPPGGAASMVIAGDGPDNGTVSSTSANANYQWFAGGPLTVELARTAGQDWSGEWKVTFVDTTGQHPDAVSNINLSLTSDFAVAPVVDPTAAWRAGKTSGPIEFHPQTLAGEDVPVTAIPAGFTTTATVTMPGQNGATTDIPVSLTEPSAIAIPEGVSPGLATVKVDLDGQVAGQPLGTVSRQVAVQILPPLGVPIVDPNQLVDFGQIEGAVAAQATLAVTGPADGDGCVTVAAGRLLSTPPSVTSVTVSGPAGSGCFPVPAGQTVQVPLTLQPGQEGNGHLSGELTVSLAPAGDPGRITDAPIRYQADMIRLPQAPVKIAILIAAFLLCLLIPLFLIWLARRLGARFPSGDQVALQMVLIEVKIGANLTNAGGGALEVPPVWSPVPDPGPGRRTLSLSGVPLTAHAGWRFTEPGYALVDDDGDSVGACSAPPHSDSRGRPRLPLSVQGTWTVLIPRGPAVSPLTELSGRLLLVVDTAAHTDARQRLIADAERDAPAAVEAARVKAKSAAPTLDSDPPTGLGAGAPGAPEYAPFGQPAPAEWGAGQSSGWGQPGGQNQPATGWGQPGPAGPPTTRNSPGWGAADSNPPSNPRANPPANPPRSDGW